MGFMKIMALSSSVLSLHFTLPIHEFQLLHHGSNFQFPGALFQLFHCCFPLKTVISAWSKLCTLTTFHPFHNHHLFPTYQSKKNNQELNIKLSVSPSIKHRKKTLLDNPFLNSPLSMLLLLLPSLCCEFSSLQGSSPIAETLCFILRFFVPFELAFNFVPVFERSNIPSKLNIQIYFQISSLCLSVVPRGLLPPQFNKST